MCIGDEEGEEEGRWWGEEEEGEEEGSWGFRSGVDPTERDGREGTAACVCVCCVCVCVCVMSVSADKTAPNQKKNEKDLKFGNTAVSRHI